MNNRLGDLPNWAGESDSEQDQQQQQVGGGGGGVDIEMGKLGGNRAPTKDKQQQQQELFLTAVESIKRDIEEIIEATRAIEKINDQTQKATTTEKEQDLSNNLRRVLDGTNNRARAAKKLLDDLKTENKALEKSSTTISNNSDLRVRENFLNTLTRKFMNETKLYQAAQQAYKTNIQQKVKRQVLVVKPDATDEEVEEIIRSEGGRDELYKQTILVGGVNEEIRTVVVNVADKYQDIRALEQSVGQLHQLVLDFALLVEEQQGELLNNIEHNVQQATNRLEEGNDNVQKAIEYQTKARKRQITIVFVVVVVVAILCLATLFL